MMKFALSSLILAVITPLAVANTSGCGTGTLKIEFRNASTNVLEKSFEEKCDISEVNAVCNKNLKYKGHEYLMEVREESSTSVGAQHYIHSYFLGALIDPSTPKSSIIGEATSSGNEASLYLNRVPGLNTNVVLRTDISLCRDY